MRYLFFGLAVLLAASCEENKDSYEVLFVGDLLLDRGVRARIENVGIDGLVDQTVVQKFKEVEHVVANLECPVTEIQESINKQYIFRDEPKWLDYLKSIGITHLNLANNHSMDQGREGLVSTQVNILNFDIQPTGFGYTMEKACQPILMSVHPYPVYLLSSVLVISENWTYLPNQPSVCEASVGELCDKIKTLKPEESDARVIVQLHWGMEHTTMPLPQQKQQALELVEAGADVIVEHHSHTIQTVERIQGKPVIYGIGNFVFDQSAPMNSEGLLVKLKFEMDTVLFDTLRFQINQCSPELLP